MVNLKNVYLLGNVQFPMLYAPRKGGGNDYLGTLKDPERMFILC